MTYPEDPAAPKSAAARAAAPVAPFPPREDGDRVSDAALVARISGEHHASALRALPYLVALLAKAAGFHRRRNAKLAALCDAGQELAERLEGWIEEEERDLFPALLAGGPEGDSARIGLDRMDQRHRATCMLLRRIRWLADDYAVPPWADRGYQTLMEELEALERDQLEHVRIEGAVLVPRLAARCAVAA